MLRLSVALTYKLNAVIKKLYDFMHSEQRLTNTALAFLAEKLSLMSSVSKVT